MRFTSLLTLALLFGTFGGIGSARAAAPQFIDFRIEGPAQASAVDTPSGYTPHWASTTRSAISKIPALQVGLPRSS